MDLPDPLREPRILKRAIGRRAALPVVKAGPARAGTAARRGDGIVALLRGDERVALAYRPSSFIAEEDRRFSQDLPLHPQLHLLVRQPLETSHARPDSGHLGAPPSRPSPPLSQWRNVTSEIPRSLANRRCGLSPLGAFRSRLTAKVLPDTAASFSAPDPILSPACGNKSALVIRKRGKSSWPGLVASGPALAVMHGRGEPVSTLLTVEPAPRARVYRDPVSIEGAGGG